MGISYSADSILFSGETEYLFIHDYIATYIIPCRYYIFFACRKEIYGLGAFYTKEQIKQNKNYKKCNRLTFNLIKIKQNINRDHLRNRSSHQLR